MGQRARPGKTAPLAVEPEKTARSESPRFFRRLFCFFASRALYMVCFLLSDNGATSAWWRRWLARGKYMLLCCCRVRNRIRRAYPCRFPPTRSRPVTQRHCVQTLKTNRKTALSSSPKNSRITVAPADSQLDRVWIDRAELCVRFIGGKKLHPVWKTFGISRSSAVPHCRSSTNSFGLYD